MQIKLDKLTLSNFKGIKSLEIDFNGKNADISGQNATGKTTIVDAFTWLLFDKDSNDKKDFNIKTIDENGNVIHGLEHSVTAILDISGTRIELKKSYYEKWTKQRGSVDKVFTGHTTDYFVDGVPVKKSEYADKIASIVSEDIFKLLANPLYFNDQLHWQKRRELLFQVCGDVSDDDVISQKPKLAELKGILGNHKIDDYKKNINSRKRKVNDELEKIPVRIDEVVKGKPDLKEINFAMVRRNLADHQAENEKLRNTIVQLQNSGGVADKERRIAEIDNELYQLTTAAKREQDEAMRDLKSEINNRYMDIAQASRHAESKTKLINNLNKDLESINQSLEAQRSAFIKERDKQFEFSQESVCPTCGQDIPESQLEDARKKALDKFNLEKSKMLEHIRSDGHRRKAQAEDIQSQIDEVKKAIEEDNATLAALNDEIKALEIKLKGIKESLVDVTQTKEYITLIDEKTKLQEAIRSIKSGAQEEIQKVRETIQSNEEAMKLMQATLAKEEQAKQADARIEELKAEEKELAEEYAQLEKEQYLIEEFIRTKVSLIESSINTQFNMVRFKLFNEQVNGALDETCETLINSNGAWVPWTDANSAGRINAGLDIIRTLSDHYDVSAPMFVDNAESVNQLIPIDSQVIRLVVTHDEKLKVEVSE